MSKPDTTGSSLAELIYDEHYPGWRALYFPMEGQAATLAPDLAVADLHITIAGGHCGKANCTRCDPMERHVDGLTVRECLARYEAWQREDVSKTEWARTEPRKPAYARRDYLTTAQVEAARAAWSAQLRARVEQAEEKERAQVVCERDEDGL